MMKSKSKKIAKMLLAFMLVVSTVIGLNPSAVFAGDSKTYSLYFNSPQGPNGTSLEIEIIYYGGTNYFVVDGLSGSSNIKIVTCTGSDVDMRTVQRTSVSTTSFKYMGRFAGQISALLNTTLTNDGKATAYANGRIYN